ncbi:MAG: lysophospholipid acyltransferase family protein [Sphingorhabdus sp.]
MTVLRHMIFTLAFFGGSVLLVGIAFLTIWTSPEQMRRAVRKWSQHQYLCARYILGVRIRVEGQLSEGPVLYAIKHESMFETIDMPRFINCPAVIAKQQLFSIPLWGRAALTYGLIPVDRDGGASALRRMLKMAREAVAQGRPIVIFPEGTRVNHGECPPLESGFAGLYKILKLQVVPIAVDSGLLSPRENRFWRSGEITYKIGEVIPSGLPRAEIEARVHAAINALNVPTR